MCIYVVANALNAMNILKNEYNEYIKLYDQFGLREYAIAHNLNVYDHYSSDTCNFINDNMHKLNNMNISNN